MLENGDLSLSERKWWMVVIVLFKDVRYMCKLDSLGREILQIAFPAALGLAADPIASLIDTAFIGRLGAVEIAAVGVSIAIFNQVSKVTIFPLVNITTSFVAEEETVVRITSEAPKIEELENGSIQNNKEIELMPDDVLIQNLKMESATKTEMKELIQADDSAGPVCKSATFTRTNLSKLKIKGERRHIPSASTALVIGGILGVLQTLFLIFLAKPILSLMGVKAGSPMLTPAQRYLTLRSLGAPAVLLSLAMQGIFRGLKDTKTPLYATVAGDVTNIILDPIFIFACHLGVSGAAIAHVLSQYLISLILLCTLMKKVDLLPPSIKDMQFSRFLRNGSYLLARVIAATSCVTLAASLAARQGSTSMAAFQVCLQVWLTSSLLADGLAVAGQAILASAFAEKDYEKATAAASRVLQFGSGVFSRDKNVIHLISIGVPFVAGTQPLNSLAFVLDGVNFGASDFAYSAYSMVLVAILSIGTLFLLSKYMGFVGLWLALAIYMTLRTVAGICRIGTGTGPWRFLRARLL